MAKEKSNKKRANCHQVNKSEYEKRVTVYESELEKKNHLIQQLEKKLSDKKLEGKYKDEKIAELEKWLQLFMQNVTQNLQ